MSDNPPVTASLGWPGQTAHGASLGWPRDVVSRETEAELIPDPDAGPAGDTDGAHGGDVDRVGSSTTAADRTPADPAPDAERRQAAAGKHAVSTPALGEPDRTHAERPRQPDRGTEETGAVPPSGETAVSRETRADSAGSPDAGPSSLEQAGEPPASLDASHSSSVEAPPHPAVPEGQRPETGETPGQEPPTPLRADDPIPDSIKTAAQLAENAHHGEDGAPPLARATEHAMAVSAGRPIRRDLPRPAQTRVMVVANQKGGVGKTTTAVNVAAALAQHGHKVLVADLDPQGNASTALSIEHSEGTPGTYGVLVEGTPLRDVIAECKEIPGLYVVPATIDLAGAEIELVSLVARESRLRKALDAHLAETEEAGERYDFVFVDCPPSLGLLTVNALSAGREMLIPIQCEYYALEGLSQLLRTIEQIREHLNPELRVGAIMLTMFDGRTRLAAGVADEVRRHFGEVVLDTAIPRSVRISEAPSYGQTVLTYDPGSTGSLSYLEAARELAQQSEDNT